MWTVVVMLLVSFRWPWWPPEGDEHARRRVHPGFSVVSAGCGYSRPLARTTYPELRGIVIRKIQSI
jgi:hypothetical protein